MRWSDALLKPQANNFTFVRLLLASSVIYSHSYWAVFGVEGKDDLTSILGLPISVYAVDGFFFLSGFLVYPSLIRLGDPKRFLLARLVRLWPGLALSVLLTVLGGVFLTSAPLGAYLEGETARFIRGNLSFVFGAFSLTGVNCGNQLCNVNGSLWTLPWEARCYITLAVLGFAGFARPEYMKRFVLPATLVCVLIWDFAGVRGPVISVIGSGPAYSLDMMDRLWVDFALGIAAYLFRDRLILSWPILGALFLLNFVTQRAGVDLHAQAILTGYAVLCLGVRTAAKGAFSGNWPDYSYGTYIFAFPIMMVLHGIWGALPHLALATATFAVTLPLAAFSWHVVEKPSLNAFRRKQRGVSPVIA